MLTPDRYPLPNLCTAYELLHGAEIFSTIDLKSAFHHVPVAPEDIHKPTIRTPVGPYAFTRTPFGLSTSAQVFQRLIDTVTRELSFVHGYVDDLLIFSKTEEEHLENLTILFERPNEHGLTLNLKICKFGRKEIKFLGHVIRAEGVQLASEKIEAIRSFKKPKNIKSLRRFTGIEQFYAPFIPNLLRKLVPLYDMMRGKYNLQSTLKWTPETTTAFEEAKSSMANFTALAFLAPGAVLQQEVDGMIQLLGLFSRVFPRSQHNYYAVERDSAVSGY